MKCPYCNKEMWHPIGKPTWSCQNWDCMESEGMIGNHVLWQALIDTKKKLDRYENALTFIRNINGAGLSYSEMCIDMREVAKKALNPEHSMVLLGRYSDEYLLSNLEQIKDNDKDVK